MSSLSSGQSDVDGSIHSDSNTNNNNENTGGYNLDDSLGSSFDDIEVPGPSNRSVLSTDESMETDESEVRVSASRPRNRKKNVPSKVEGNLLFTKYFSIKEYVS